ncbi:hypothetical protein TL16_g08627 [Triparma laevis f. inornata]|uniref:Uncharacterized protein n=1 Tax=Triparma laevis f. inornata TaxID=1714386 RepID=A0A9W7EJ72_9STRA|nr:hypothetical protein TL16_g08627 [Triparma laevis f. inornata]
MFVILSPPTVSKSSVWNLQIPNASSSLPLSSLHFSSPPQLTSPTLLSPKTLPHAIIYTTYECYVLYLSSDLKTITKTAVSCDFGREESGFFDVIICSEVEGGTEIGLISPVIFDHQSTSLTFLLPLTSSLKSQLSSLPLPQPESPNEDIYNSAKWRMLKTGLRFLEDTFGEYEGLSEGLMISSNITGFSGGPSTTLFPRRWQSLKILEEEKGIDLFSLKVDSGIPLKHYALLSSNSLTTYFTLSKVVYPRFEVESDTDSEILNSEELINSFLKTGKIEFDHKSDHTKLGKVKGIIDEVSNNLIVYSSKGVHVNYVTPLSLFSKTVGVEFAGEGNGGECKAFEIVSFNDKFDISGIEITTNPESGHILNLHSPSVDSSEIKTYNLTAIYSIQAVAERIPKGEEEEGVEWLEGLEEFGGVVNGVMEGWEGVGVLEGGETLIEVSVFDFVTLIFVFTYFPNLIAIFVGRYR